MHKTILASIAVAAVLASALASAQTTRGDITRAQVEEQAGAAFDRMDVNDDGRIDEADRGARQRARFERLDADRNGALSFAEFSAARDRPAEMRGQRAENRAGERSTRAGMGRMAMMRRADAKRDGTIDRAEFTSRALTRFEQADADGNGTLTAAERRASRDAMHASRPGGPDR